MRQDFVANVSHELRTPLTVVHGYLESLLDRFQDDPETHKIFEQMLQQSLRMERLVEDLLLLSRLESDTPLQENFKPVLIEHLTQQLVKDAKALGIGKHQTFSIDIEKNLRIQGEENELSSAFSNLIFNAVNYTPSHGEIHIRCYQDKKNIYFEVKDTGIGIAPEHIDRITERFYRVDRDRSRKSGGTGLGLAIVKHVLIRHNATLSISSTLDSGSTFTCVFPLPSKPSLIGVN